MKIMLTELHENVLLKIYGIIRNSGENICWGLTGSTSFALQGVDVEPHDIDIQTDGASAYILGRLLAEYEVQPVMFCGNAKIRSHFGKYLIDGMEVEIMGDIQKSAGDHWEDIVPLESILDYISWHDVSIPVLKLSYEAEAYEKLGRIAKAKMLRDYLN